MPSISPRMVGVYLVLFWIQCVVGIGINLYNQIWIWQQADINIAETILQVILISGAVGIGAATNSLVVVLTAEGTMALAEWVRKKQFKEGVEVGKKEGIEQGIEQGLEKGIEQGIEQGKEMGRSEERKRISAMLRALGEEYDIPEDKLTIKDEDEND